MTRWIPTTPSIADAQDAVRNYIDYFMGVAIKCNLSRDEVDLWLYDRDATFDTAEEAKQESGFGRRVIQQLRKKLCK